MESGFGAREISLGVRRESKKKVGLSGARIVQRNTGQSHDCFVIPVCLVTGLAQLKQRFRLGWIQMNRFAKVLDLLFAG